jgi:glycosyltransferase involved in cell wall biosynthesis
MRILFLSGWFPDPPNNGSKLRIINLLRALAQAHEVSLISFSDKLENDISESELQSLCQEIQIVPERQFVPQNWRAKLGYFSLMPRSVVATYSEEMEWQITRFLNGNDYDLIIASQLGIAGYSHCFQGKPALLEEVEVALLRESFSQAESAKEKFRHSLTWAKQKRYLNKLLLDYKACTVASDREKQLLEEAVSTEIDVTVVPNCIDLNDYVSIKQTPKSGQLIFSGSFRYFANYEAMIWFLQEIFPLILVEEPETQLIITGDHADLSLPSIKNVTLTGYVDDIGSLIASSWLSLVPLQVGGGTRLKILEAMALHTPVVSTTKGAEGLGAQHGDHLLIADSPHEFAEAVVLLLRDPDLRHRLTDNAYQFVSKNYDCHVTNARFLDLIERIVDV